MKRALLATDASDASLRAARMLGAMARLDPDLQVTVLHVLPLPDTFTPSAAAVGAPLTLPSHLEEYEEAHVKEVLEKTEQALALAPERVKVTHEIGLAADTILAEAKLGQFDLIVMGRRGLTPIREMFLGSVSQTVLHRAHIPVLIVP